jgi:hypothetical protein
MNGKKIAALLIAGSLTASVGVTAGAFTKAEGSKTKAKSAQTQMKKRSWQNIQGSMKTKIDTLVKDGKITQAVEDKVISYLNQKETALKAEMDKIKSMSAAERKTYLESRVNGQKTGILAEMVSANVLTQAEADSLKAALPELQKGQKMMSGGHFGRLGAGMMQPADIQKNIKSKLDTLVQAGTITQAVEDSVLASYNQLAAQKQAEMDKIKSMTQAERKAYFESKVKAQSQDPIADLVKAGTITQAQADAIKNVFPGHGKFGGRHIKG